MKSLGNILETRIGKAFALATVILGISLMFSISKTNAVIGYIETNILVEKGEQFSVNEIYASHSVVSANDIIETKDTEVTFVLNQTSSVTLKPFSSLSFLKLGDSPILHMLKGEADIQTNNEVKAFIANNIVTIKQGGTNILLKDSYAQFGNYYGATTLTINGANQETVLTYSLPIQKKVSIFHNSNKSNWNKIRYSKLNKELRLTSFDNIIARETFIPQSFNSLLSGDTTSVLQKLLTFNPQKKKNLLQLEFNKNFAGLVKAIENKSAGLIKKRMPEFQEYRDLPQIHALPKLIATINDPFVRYTYEVELAKIFLNGDKSLNTEIKYFYSLWNNKNDKQLKEFQTMFDKKIASHTNNLLRLEENYNLIVSLIEAYPGIVTPELLASKRTVENAIFNVVETDTEKVDIILSTFEKDMGIISLLIENNNGALAKNVYKSMLVDTVDFEHPAIASYRSRYASLEENIQTLLNFYKEFLHSAAYNENIFQDYKEQKAEEKEAIELFQKNVKTLRTRPVRHDFSNVVSALAKNKIHAEEENISFVLLGGNLLFIQNAEVVPNLGETTFNFVFNPETQTISELIWNTTQDSEAAALPPLEQHVPLNKFQESYLYLQSLQSNLNTTTQKTPESDLSDWTLLAENLTDFNLDIAIKKRLAKETLLENGILAQERQMQVFNNSIQVSNAFITYSEDRKMFKVPFHVRLQMDTWNVLGLQLADFEQSRPRVGTLKDVTKVVIAAHKVEDAKRQTQELALKSFKGISPLLEIDNFIVQDAETPTVAFENIPLSFTLNNQVEVWYAQGLYTTNNRVFPSITLTSQGRTIVEKDLAIGRLKIAVKEYLEGTKKKDTQEVIDEADKVIQETMQEEISDAELEEVKEMLNNGEWF